LRGAFDNTTFFYSDYAISGIFGLLPSNVTSAFGAISQLYSSSSVNSIRFRTVPFVLTPS
jgi:hypothetical protein